MSDFGNNIRKLRESKNLPLRKVAAHLDIDQAVLSKIERGLRAAKRNHIRKLAQFFETDEKELMLHWLADKVVKEIGNEELALESLHVAEEIIAYQISAKPDRMQLINAMKNYFRQDRRVIKAWIFGSFAREDDDSASDIDLMIEIPGDMRFTLFDFADIQYKLEDLLKRKVDLVEKDAMKPFAWETAKKEITLIYED